MAQPSVGDDAFQDFLLDMDFDELIPVDNFFNNYVGTLSEKQGTFGAALHPLQITQSAYVFEPDTSVKNQVLCVRWECGRQPVSQLAEEARQAVPRASCYQDSAGVLLCSRRQTSSSDRTIVTLSC